VLTDRARRVARRSRLPYMAAAPLVGGLGVWSTHFIAMQAYDAGVPVRYDPAETLLSLAIITLALGASISLVSQPLVRATVQSSPWGAERRAASFLR
ncbi:MHYT domain-containing protein, partial [Brevundimonas naejangsanensis]